VFELLKRDGRRGWASGSDEGKIKKSCQISTRFWVRVIHTLSTGYPQPVNISRTYPQVIHNREELSTGCSHSIHTLSTTDSGGETLTLFRIFLGIWILSAPTQYVWTISPSTSSIHYRFRTCLNIRLSAMSTLPISGSIFASI